jgi:hypothetical protein
MFGRTKFTTCKAQVLFVGVLLAITPFPVKTQQSGPWESVIGPDRSFTGEMPAVPRYSEEKLKSGAGTAYTMYKYVVDQGEAAYIIQTAVYPTDVDVSSPKTNLQAGLDHAAKNMKDGKWTSVRWLEHQALVAVDALGTRGELELRNYSVMKGSQIFSLTYGGPPGSARTPNVDRFVNSLQIPK